MPGEVSDEITYPFQNFNDCTVLMAWDPFININIE